MIERWFPSAEVTANSAGGWGSANNEIGLFPWFAKRPTAQAKAAVLCSLLPWPESEAEQKRLQDLVKEAMTGRYAARKELRKEILQANPEGASVLDPFSGRGIIPLEAVRLGLDAHAVDYSPVAVLASSLLTDFPFRNWDGEPELPFTDTDGKLYDDRPRLLRDVTSTFHEVERRWRAEMADFYPAVNGKQPRGYFWAVALPCQECGNEFPLVNSFALRMPSKRKGKKGQPAILDPGQSFRIEVDRAAGTYKAVVFDGAPATSPTLANANEADGSKISGKSATCTFCNHVHPVAVHRRLANERKGRDRLLVVADHGDDGLKTYREPMEAELRAAESATSALNDLPSISPFLTAFPDEGIAPGNNNIIGPSIYGARTYGDLMCDRQTLSFATLARVINEVVTGLVADYAISADYARALAGYCGSAMARTLKASTRGATLYAPTQIVTVIYLNEGSLTYSYDFFEASTGTGPGTWASLSRNSLAVLEGLLEDAQGTSASVARGSATQLSYRSGAIQAVVTDPPYDQMIAYADASDLMYVWLKRALHGTWPEFVVTSDPYGTQEKTDEIIVKRVRGKAPDEHRTRLHYDTKIALAFREMRRAVREDGVVTIVFGSGDLEVWKRFLAAIQEAGLVMTGSWPASTESGGRQGKANIKTTLTMACRPAPAGRRAGRKGAVEREIRNEIADRYPDWLRWGLAPADMLMAAAGPAMEVAGRYGEVLDAKGDPVDIHTFLPLARAAVQAVMAVEIDHHPLETFDSRTRFALWWVRLYGRQIQAKSELRWQTLASSLEIGDVRDLVPETSGGVAFTSCSQFSHRVHEESSIIDVALALAGASQDGTVAMGEILAASGRDADDAYLWAAISFLADRLPDADADAIAWSRVLRARGSIAAAAASSARSAASARTLSDQELFKLP